MPLVSYFEVVPLGESPGIDVVLQEQIVDVGAFLPSKKGYLVDQHQVA